MCISCVRDNVRIFKVEGKTLENVRDQIHSMVSLAYSFGESEGVERGKREAKERNREEAYVVLDQQEYELLKGSNKDAGLLVNAKFVTDTVERLINEGKKITAIRYLRGFALWASNQPIRQGGPGSFNAEALPSVIHARRRAEEKAETDRMVKELHAMAERLQQRGVEIRIEGEDV